MEVESKVWVARDDEEVWVPATVKAKSDSKLEVEFEDLSTEEFKEDLDKIKHRNENVEMKQINDLVSLQHLHEPSILHALEVRYYDPLKIIYTQIGDILLSINPYARIPRLYAPELISAYFNNDDIATEKDEMPHLYAIARNAFVDMVKNAKNQSILVSGESGAGKTEAAKIIMKYLASTTSNHKSSVLNEDSNNPSIETQVLESNPVLEAFGNARTIRNDNSSRFGKFIEIQFTCSASNIAGAKIRSYLLEKVRLISQAQNERNFHIFYELLAGATEEQRSLWNILPINKFHYLNQSNCYKRRDKVDDQVQFKETLKAMQHVGIIDEEREEILSIVVSLLHLGNLEFSSVADDAIKVTDETFSHLETASQILKVSCKGFEEVILQRKIVSNMETFSVFRTVAQASAFRHAITMACYRGLFSIIVKRINETLCVDDDTVECDKFIGILDLFGFENMETNSFEQLCINYANESFQQQFNNYVFHNEKLLYKKEKILWDLNIAFPDNSKCIELFEKKPIGIFSLIDQECMFPRGSDSGLAGKLYKQFDINNASSSSMSKTENSSDDFFHFYSPPKLRREEKFIIRHYAGEIEYCIEGFLNKNRDALQDSAIDLLKSSGSDVVKQFGDDPNENEEKKKKTSRLRRRVRSSIGSVSVASQFKLQLNDLLEIINETNSHYIRCIKPNDINSSSKFNRVRVVDQLRSGGVLEAVRVARAGYPVRLTHKDFLLKYSPFIHSMKKKIYSKSNTNTPKENAQAILVCLNVDLGYFSDADVKESEIPQLCAKHGAQVGNSKVFFRKDAFEKIELWVRTKKKEKVLKIQSYWRMFLCAKLYRRTKKSIVVIQSYYRMSKAKSILLSLRRERAAILFQKQFRCYTKVQDYKKKYSSIRTIQQFFRFYTAYRIYKALKKEWSIKVVQRNFRMWNCRLKYVRTLRSTLCIQCAWRVKTARKIYLAKRSEFFNVKGLQDDNQRLKLELSKLKSELAIKIEEQSKKVEEEVKNTILQSKDTNQIILNQELQEKCNALVTENEKILMEKEILEEQKTNLEEKVALLKLDLAATNIKNMDLIDTERTQQAKINDLIRNHERVMMANSDLENIAAKFVMQNETIRVMQSELQKLMISSEDSNEREMDICEKFLALQEENERLESLVKNHGREENQEIPDTLNIENKECVDICSPADEATESEDENLPQVIAINIVSPKKRVSIQSLPVDDVQSDVKVEEVQTVDNVVSSFENHDSPNHNLDNQYKVSSNVTDELSIESALCGTTHSEKQTPEVVAAPLSDHISEYQLNQGQQKTLSDEDREMFEQLKIEEEVSELKSQLKIMSNPNQEAIDVESQRKIMEKLLISQMKSQSLKIQRQSSYQSSYGSEMTNDDIMSDGSNLTPRFSDEMELEEHNTSSNSSFFPSLGELQDRFSNTFSSTATTIRSSRNTSQASSNSNSLNLIPKWSNSNDCTACGCNFGILVRRHHCRQCGESFCNDHSTRQMALPDQGYPEPVRICDECFESNILDRYQKQKNLTSSSATSVY